MLRTTITGHVATLELDRPASRNALNAELVTRLKDSITKLDHDPKVRCIILTGKGQSFCSGGDLEEMRTGTGLFHGEGNTLADTYRTGIQQIPRLLERMGTPLIAAVNGPAVGAGCDLALMCDLRIGSPRASFAESFVRLGIISGDGGAWILPRAVGFSVACDMALTGRTLTSQEALQAGLISRLTGEDNLMDEAQEMAARIAANPPSAVRIMRQQLRHQHHQTLDEALEFSAVAQAERHACQDHLAILNSLNISRA